MLVDGIVASSMTPFSPDGDLRLDLIPAHVDWLIGEGVSGISPLGSSGEFVGIESDDRKRVIEAVTTANAGRVHIMAGTHHYSTRIARDLSRHAEQAGANSLLVTPPYYMHPSINQVLDHYRHLADAVRIPIVVYYNFGGTNIDLRTEHLVTLFEEKVIAGVKLSNGNPDRICELLQATDRRLVVYAGIDTVAFEGLCHGAHGWISALPSIVPRAAKQLYETIAIQGDLPSARRQWRALAPLMRLVFREHLGAGNDPNWLAIMKATLNMIGPSVGDPLLPIQPLDARTKEIIAGMVRDLGYEVHA
ncbi:MAG TPA: dihydrodipicolinate synthase family protein [Chloroflexota bacterium]